MTSQELRPKGSKPSATNVTEIVRILVGLIWLVGALFNALVTMRMPDPYKWLAEGSRFLLWRSFFTNIVNAHRSEWTALLVLGELALGVLTLTRGTWARLGLLGGSIFSFLLFSLGTGYTLVMGPYALLLGWLSRHRFRRTV